MCNLFSWKPATAAAILLAAVTAGAQPASILLVSDNAYADGRTGDPEAAFESFLTGLGYDVIRATGSGLSAQFRTGNEGHTGAGMVGADLIIISRVTDSGQYNNPSGWNGLTTPILSMAPHLARSSRWMWFNSTSLDEGDVTDLVFTEPNHPFVDGRGTEIFNPASSLSRLGVTGAGNGTVIATTPDGDVAIAQWDAGTAFYSGGPTPAGDRVFVAGHRYHETGGGGTIPYTFDDFTDNGKALLAQTITSFVPVPEPSVISLWVLGLGGLAWAVRRRLRS